MTLNWEIFKKRALTIIGNSYLFLIGFSLCANIFAVFVYGSTAFTLPLLLPLPLIIYRLIKDKKMFFAYFKSLPISFYCFLLSILISIIIAIFYTNNFLEYSRTLKGLLIFGLNSFSLLLTGIMVGNNKRFVFLGLTFGFILNAVTSIISFFAFYIFGYILTLNKTFVLDAFYANNYSFGAQGLFLEPSHFAGFVLVIYYVLFWYYKNSRDRIMLTICAWIMFILYGQGNTILFIISQMILLFFLFGKRIFHYVKTEIMPHKTRIVVTLAIFFLAVGIILILALIPFRPFIVKILNEANPLSSANTERFLSVMVGLNIFINNPWGVGYNLGSTIIGRLYGDVLSTASTHNFWVRIMVEQGLLGILSFVLFIAVILKKTLHNTNKNSCVLFIAVFSGALYTFLNIPNEPYLYFSLGLVCFEMGFDSSIALLKKKQKFLYRFVYRTIKI